MNIKAASLISFFLVALSVGLYGDSRLHPFLYGEYGFVEGLQLVFLALCLFFTIASLSNAVKRYGFLLPLLRLMFIVFLIYEELSYLAPISLAPKIASSNMQNELNLHNSKLLNTLFFEVGPLHFSLLEIIYFSLWATLAFSALIPFLASLRPLYLGVPVNYLLVPIPVLFAYRLILRILGRTPFDANELPELYFYCCFFLDCCLLKNELKSS